MQLRCRNSKNDMEALQTKGGFDFQPFLQVKKNSAKSVTVAQ